MAKQQSESEGVEDEEGDEEAIVGPEAVQVDVGALATDRALL